MSLDYVLIGSDTNPYYFDFWPTVSKVWSQVFKVKPVLGLISDEDSEIYEDQFGLVKKFKKVEGIDIGLQSQIVRFYLANFLEGNCLISDIDMLPLSKNYFEGTCSRLNSENMVIHSSDNPECLKANMYPMCYVAANSTVFKNTFDLNLSWEDFCNLLHNRNETWYTDQKYLFEKVNQYNEINKNVIFLKRGWNGPADRRIDRINWRYNPERVNSGFYIDSHLLRPFAQYQNEINNLVNLLY